MEFKEALAVHLEAIKQRDLDTYKNTVHENDDVRVILLNGKEIKGYDEIIKLHQAWFGDPDWSIAFDIVDAKQCENTGLALLKVHYDDLDEKGIPYQKTYWLSLHFQRIHSQWKLVFDQNTDIV